jgi:hypothetical protein
MCASRPEGPPRATGSRADAALKLLGTANACQHRIRTVS